MEYDEDSVLTRYVCNHYKHLLTDFERKTINAMSARMKAELTAPYDHDMAQIIDEKWALLNDPTVNDALANSYEAYRRQVRDRILNDYKDQVFINRCSQCNCIVRTPEAKLCLWCGHSWFDQN